MVYRNKNSKLILNYRTKRLKSKEKAVARSGQHFLGLAKQKGNATPSKQAKKKLNFICAWPITFQDFLFFHFAGLSASCCRKKERMYEVWQVAKSLN